MLLHHDPCLSMTWIGDPKLRTWENHKHGLLENMSLAWLVVTMIGGTLDHIEVIASNLIRWIAAAESLAD